MTGSSPSASKSNHKGNPTQEEAVVITSETAQSTSTSSSSSSTPASMASTASTMLSSSQESGVAFSSPPSSQEMLTMSPLAPAQQQQTRHPPVGQQQGVPLMQPNPYLLQVIQSTGGTGEVFTLRQIIYHVKEYIGQRLMYDQRDPRIVYCDGDLLEKALGVKKFTILQAIGLFRRNCTPVQEAGGTLGMHGNVTDLGDQSSQGLRNRTSFSSTAGSPEADSRSNPTSGRMTSPQSAATTTAAATTTESSLRSNPAQQAVQETITVTHERMMRPNPYLLQVIWSAGGTGEVFTMRRIINHVRDYISQHNMYDQRDPRIVYCEGDLLGTALGVKQFTIEQAIGLFRRSSTLVQDTCTRTQRHLEVIDIPQEASEVSINSSQESNSSRLETQSSQDVGPSASQTSIELSQPSSSSQLSSLSQSSQSSSSTVISAAKSAISISEADLRLTHDLFQNTHIVSDGRRQGAPASKDVVESRLSTVLNTRLRPPGSGINVRLDEPDGDVGQWACSVSIEADSSNQQDEDETLLVEYESDAFSVEYEVASSSDGEGAEDQKQGEKTRSRSRTESEVSSSSSGQRKATAMLVVCKESDIEYLADYSDSDTGSDVELSDADKWACSYCSVKNPPFQRNCGGCWSVRSDWLPHSGKCDVGVPETNVAKGDNQPGPSVDSRESVAHNKDVGAQQSLEISSACQVSSGASNCVPVGQAQVTVAQVELSESQSLESGNPLVSRKGTNEKALLGITNDIPNLEPKSTQHQSSTDSNPQSLQALKAKTFKSIVASKQLRAKKRQYSSGFSTSDSHDESFKGKDPATNSKSSKAKGNHFGGTRSGKIQRQPSLYAGGACGGSTSQQEVCVVCLSRPKTASIIHGKTGHQVCCYRCARKLKKQRRACPICRRPIQKVIRNYHV